MAFVRYRDPKTGRFISRRSASHLKRRKPITEIYSPETRRRVESARGYQRTPRKALHRAIVEPALEIGIPSDFIQDYLSRTPEPTFDELLEEAIDAGVLDPMAGLEDLEDLDVDREMYGKKGGGDVEPMLSFQMTTFDGSREVFELPIESPLFRPGSTRALSKVIGKTLIEQSRDNPDLERVFIVLQTDEGFRTIFPQSDLISVVQEMRGKS